MNDSVPKPPSKRRFFRFSLRTLLLFTIFLGSGGTLSLKWNPWRITKSIRVGNYEVWDLSPDRRTVAVFSDKAYVIDVATMQAGEKVDYAVQQHMKWSRDSSRILTDTIDNPFRTWKKHSYNVWDGHSMKLIRSFPMALSSSIYQTGCVLSPDGKRAYMCAYPEFAGTKCVDVDTGKVVWAVPLQYAWLSLDPSGRFLFTGRWVLDAANGNTLWTQDTFPDPRDTQAFSDDGKYFAVAYQDKNGYAIHCFDTLTFQELFSERLSERECQGLKFSPSGSLLGIAVFDPDSARLEFRASDNGVLAGWTRCKSAYLDFFDDEHFLIDRKLQNIRTNQIVASYPCDPPIFSLDKNRALLIPYPGECWIYSKSGREICKIPNCYWAFWIDSDHIYCDMRGSFAVFTRVRPDGRFGLIATPECWATLLSFFGLLFSLRADWRKKVAA